MKQCKNFRRYAGLLPPRCNKGRPCLACRKKFAENQDRERALQEYMIRCSIYGGP